MIFKDRIGKNMNYMKLRLSEDNQHIILYKTGFDPKILIFPIARLKEDNQLQNSIQTFIGERNYDNFFKKRENVKLKLDIGNYLFKILQNKIETLKQKEFLKKDSYPKDNGFCMNLNYNNFDTNIIKTRRGGDRHCVYNDLCEFQYRHGSIGNGLTKFFKGKHPTACFSYQKSNDNTKIHSSINQIDVYVQSRELCKFIKQMFQIIEQQRNKADVRAKCEFQNDMDRENNINKSCNKVKTYSRSKQAYYDYLRAENKVAQNQQLNNYEQNIYDYGQNILNQVKLSLSNKKKNKNRNI